MGEIKGVLIQPRISDPLLLPTISKKDKSAINIGLKAGLKYLALSFTRSEDAVREVRLITKNQMKIISKIECLDGLNNLDEIIRCSDMLLIDRGDLSKEIPIDKIPFAQKFIIEKAKRQNTPVYVATNFLESMITNRQPTKAEVHDTIATILDGAEGIILVSGPTGSGKTTTLYSTLNIIERPDVNIVTIEDPIEYDMDNVNQAQVNRKSGVTFSSALRTILRQDPDIIMVGEIRDPETAIIALKAAQTGHLVLATVHAQDAHKAKSRLQRLGLHDQEINECLELIIQIFDQISAIST